MKKLSLLLLTLVAAVTLNAQIFVEYFENATTGSNLEDYNDWYVSFKAAEANGVSPLIEGETLYYDTYEGSGIGKVAVLDSLIGQEKATQRISTKVVTFGEDTLSPVIGGKMYAAFMARIHEYSYNSYRDFFTWEGSSGSSFTRGRVFAKISEDNTDLYIAVSKNSSSDLAEAEVITGGVGVDHLFVLCYEAVDGDANDIITLYINPDPTLSEEQQTNKLVNIDEQSDYSETTKIKINLRQRGIGAFVGGIRVGTDWTTVLSGYPESVENIKDANNSFYSYGKSIYTSTYGNLQVYDILGKKVLDTPTSGNIDTDLKEGIYLVRFEDMNGKISSGKIVLK